MFVEEYLQELRRDRFAPRAVARYVRRAAARAREALVANPGAVRSLWSLALLFFIATFAAFLSRAHDQIRMAAYSFSNIKICGSHVGVSIGEDGPSQMGLEDLAIFAPIPGCAVLYPSDAFSAEACLESAARHPGLTYLRTSRPAMALLYSPNDAFPVGGSKILKSSDADKAVVVAAGITVHEALKAHEMLAREEIAVRIVDAYSVKPVDAEGLRRASVGAGRKVVVVEDHFESGGLGDAAARALAGEVRMIHLCIRDLPRSGKSGELLDRFGISARHIVEAVKSLISE